MLNYDYLYDHTRRVPHYNPLHGNTVVCIDKTVSHEALNQMHLEHHGIALQEHHHVGIGSPCGIHSGRGDECPQAHICERCGYALNNHISASFLCPKGGRSFSANSNTRRLFPLAYPESPEAKEIFSRTPSV